MRLLEPLTFRSGDRTAPNRLMFGPHVTNLADDERALPGRWVEYFARRAAGGCGLIVAEGASVHESDWPYERAPLASRCGEGWAALAPRCHEEGALLIASLDHAGGQGSSAYSQRELWAPSRVPEVNSREVPKWMEPEDIEAIITAFGTASRLAVAAGCDGVELNAGQHSLMRQFLSGLTNQRGDEWGGERMLFAQRVIAAARTALGRTGVLGLRLSCDELAPWAGITPEMAPAIAAALVEGGIDYVVVTRGSIFSVEKTRPDFHEPTGVNVDVCRAVTNTIHEAHRDVAVYLQGSVVDWGQAEWALTDGVADGVEMTRAQIADPSLGAQLRAGTPERIRPCIRCNQMCQVRDARNPIVSCVGEPTSGRETEDPDWYAPSLRRRDVVIVGGGVAGMEAARVAAIRGHRVRLVERSATLGGVAAVAGPGRPLVEWLIAECHRLDIDIALETEFDGRPGDALVIQATGGRPGDRPFTADADALVLDVAAVRAGTQDVPEDGTVVVFDPIGGPIGVAIAEELGKRAALVTQDNIAGNELSRTGDLAPANVRLAQQSVQIERRTLLRHVAAGHVVVEDRYTGLQRDIACAAVIDCGFRLPTEPIAGATIAIGDAVAPRTIHEAILEGRRAAASI